MMFYKKKKGKRKEKPNVYAFVCLCVELFTYSFVHL